MPGQDGSALLPINARWGKAPLNHHGLFGTAFPGQTLHGAHALLLPLALAYRHFPPTVRHRFDKIGFGLIRC